uniref:Apoptosis-associated speck-like protein containing a CARD n=1 Tax=Chelonoidis abingdonii TaxID=106734 RepID=A0A8C0HEK9_CHEAB
PGCTTARDHLLSTLANRGEAQLKNFKSKLNEIPLQERYDNIPKGVLEKADPIELTDKMIQSYQETYAVVVAVKVLRAISENQLHEEPGPHVSVGVMALHFVDRHREKLIQRRVTAVDSILDSLHGVVLDPEQYQSIRAERTNPDKMRKLYELVPSWNSGCKEKLYQALKDKHRHLVEQLEEK